MRGAVTAVMAVPKSDVILDAIRGARIGLLLERPWFGTMALRLVLVDATSWCETAATDGRHLFYNREFVKRLTEEELKFVICHEMLHVVYDHMGRLGNRDPDLHNMAVDYIVNHTLVDKKVGKMPSVGLLDPQFTDAMTSEEVYEILEKNSVTIKMPLDMHLQVAGDGEGEGNEGGTGSSATVRVLGDGSNGPPKLTESDIEQIRNEMRSALILSRQQFGADKIPAGVLRIIDAIIQPKMDWRALLDAHIRSMLKDDYTFNKINRRSFFLPFLLPSQGELVVVDLFISIDASGSISNEQVRDFLNEVRGIMDTFRDFRIGVVTFDGNVYNHQKFTPENINDIHNYEIKGGGGTSFEAVSQFIRDNDITAERHVMFTDGCPNDSWGDPNLIDTLFVIHGNTNIVAPFGMTAYYDAPNKRVEKRFARKNMVIEHEPA